MWNRVRKSSVSEVTDEHINRKLVVIDIICIHTEEVTEEIQKKLFNSTVMYCYNMCLIVCLLGYSSYFQPCTKFEGERYTI